MPKQGQYKQQQQQVEAVETFKYKFQLKTVFPVEFQRWIMYECFNTVQWNSHFMFRSIEILGWSAHANNLWRVYFNEYDNAIIVESNKKIFSIRKGLKFNCIQQSITVSV